MKRCTINVRKSQVYLTRTHTHTPELQSIVFHGCVDDNELKTRFLIYLFFSSDSAQTCFRLYTWTRSIFHCNLSLFTEQWHLQMGFDENWYWNAFGTHLNSHFFTPCKKFYQIANRTWLRADIQMDWKKLSELYKLKFEFRKFVG